MVSEPMFIYCVTQFPTENHTNSTASNTKWLKAIQLNTHHPCEFRYVCDTIHEARMFSCSSTYIKCYEFMECQLYYLFVSLFVWLSPQTDAIHCFIGTERLAERALVFFVRGGVASYVFFFTPVPWEFPLNDNDVRMFSSTLCGGVRMISQNIL